MLATLGLVLYHSRSRSRPCCNRRLPRIPVQQRSRSSGIQEGERPSDFWRGHDVVVRLGPVDEELWVHVPLSDLVQVVEKQPGETPAVGALVERHGVVDCAFRWEPQVELVDQLGPEFVGLREGVGEDGAFAEGGPIGFWKGICQSFEGVRTTWCGCGRWSCWS